MAANFDTLRKFQEDLKRLPQRVAKDVVAKAASKITALALETFKAGTDPYGGKWVDKVDGTPADLVETGALRASIRYIAVGAIMRFTLTLPYAKYVVGKRPVAPRAGAVLPPSWITALEQIAVAVLRDSLR